MNLLELLNTNPETKLSSGEVANFKTYLGEAINAFELKECDYNSIFFVINKF